MVAVSPEIDDNDLRIREGLLDKTLDFNSVHSHRDTLQCSFAAAMQAPNQLANIRRSLRAWAICPKRSAEVMSAFRHRGRGMFAMRAGSLAICAQRHIFVDICSPPASGPALAF